MYYTLTDLHAVTGPKANGHVNGHANGDKAGIEAVDHDEDDEDDEEEGAVVTANGEGGKTIMYYCPAFAFLTSTSQEEKEEEEQEEEKEGDSHGADLATESPAFESIPERAISGERGSGVQE